MVILFKGLANDILFIKYYYNKFIFNDIQNKIIQLFYYKINLVIKE